MEPEKHAGLDYELTTRHLELMVEGARARERCGLDRRPLPVCTVTYDPGPAPAKEGPQEKGESGRDGEQ
jgi:hypothetical protein